MIVKGSLYGKEVSKCLKFGNQLKVMNNHGRIILLGDLEILLNLKDISSMYRKGTLMFTNNKLLFFDCEVYKYNSMVVFKDSEGKTVRVFSSSLDGLGDLYEQGMAKPPF